MRGAAAGLRLACRCRVAPMLRFPTCFPSFRVVGEKQLPQEIIFLVWSPKRDLIALANTAGEVSETAGSPTNSEADRQRARTDCPSLSFSFCELGRPPVYPTLPFQVGYKLQVKVYQGAYTGKIISVPIFCILWRKYVFTQLNTITQYRHVSFSR